RRSGRGGAGRSCRGRRGRPWPGTRGPWRGGGARRRAVAGEVVPGDHQGLGEQGEGDGALHGGRGAVTGLTSAGDGFGVTEGDFDGLITNDKFCCVRRLRLSLSWWHRPLRLRGSALQSDVALVGEPDDPDVDRLPPARSAPRRRAPVGSGLPAISALGGT